MHFILISFFITRIVCFFSFFFFLASSICDTKNDLGKIVNAAITLMVRFVRSTSFQFPLDCWHSCSPFHVSFSVYFTTGHDDNLVPMHDLFSGFVPPSTSNNIDLFLLCLRLSFVTVHAHCLLRVVYERWRLIYQTKGYLNGKLDRALI